MVTKEKLEELIEKRYTRKQVSLELGIGYSTVHKYMSRHGLKFVNREVTIVNHRCESCGATSRAQFYGDRKTECKICFNRRSLVNLKENKLKAVDYKGGCCSICGYNKSVSALEFHHSDPKLKDPKWRINWGWERLKNELDKCVLLCANCHREEHERLAGVGTVG